MAHKKVKVPAATGAIATPNVAGSSGLVVKRFAPAISSFGSAERGFTPEQGLGAAMTTPSTR